MKTDRELLEIYVEYLISSTGLVTGTGLSELLERRISHDRIQRFLSEQAKSSADLWSIVKPHVRAHQRIDAVLIIDDSIAEKPYTDENDIICWHYDHAKDRTVKGINFITTLYQTGEVSLPVGFTIIAKTEQYLDKKSGKERRRSPIGKNDYFRQMAKQAVQNQIPFQYVMNDLWFASAQNMRFIKHELKKSFVMPIKTNRKVALTLEERERGHYRRVDELQLKLDTTQKVYLEEVDFALLLNKHIFKNGDGSEGVQYLVTDDQTLDGAGLFRAYQRRWSIEPYHKSLKQNASLERSPTQTIRTQTNHFFASLCGYIKLELMKVETKVNHFALKSQLYRNALKAAYETLRRMEPQQLTSYL
jgi:hypothetical protein